MFNFKIPKHLLIFERKKMKNINNFWKATIMASIFLNFTPTSFSQGQAEGGKLIMRDQIDPKYTWDLKDIYATDELWEKDFKWVEDNIPNYKKYEGRLGNSANELFAAAKFDDSMSIKLERLYLYASCSKDLDLSNSISLARYDRISQLGSKAAVAGSFIRPELLAIPKEKIDKFLEESEGLRIYKHQIEDLFRSKEHTLPKEQEEILARSSEIRRLPENAFSVFTNADMQFKTVKDPLGNDIQLSAGRYRPQCIRLTGLIAKGFTKVTWRLMSILEIPSQHFSTVKLKPIFFLLNRENLIRASNLPLTVTIFPFQFTKIWLKRQTTTLPHCTDGEK